VVVWKCGSLEVWKFGSVEVWKCGSVEVWKCGSVEVWKYFIVFQMCSHGFLKITVKVIISVLNKKHTMHCVN